jgi:dihydrofolate synthase/folylpolyglutamate synthase
MTAIAFLYFKDQKVDYAVIEVGLGGRCDATNILQPIATAITNISLEHTKWLGKTIEAISEEKAGIIKKDIPIYTGENNQIIKNTAKICKAPYTLCPPTNFPLSLKGDFQKSNASIALEIAKQLEIDTTTIKKGLKTTIWTARHQYLEKNIILDSAHNPEAMEFLKEYLDTIKYKNLTIIFSCMEDKDYKKMVKRLPKHDRLIVTKIQSPRAIDPELLLEHLPKADYIDDPIDAYKKARAKNKKDDLLLICGSIYLAGEVLSI